MKFKSGQKIICVVNAKWHFTCKTLSFWQSLFIRFRHGWGPKFNEVVTVDGYRGNGYIYIKEYRLNQDGGEYSFNEDGFEPLMTDEELNEVMETIKQPFQV